MLYFLSRIILLLIAISVIKSVVNYGRRLWYGLQGTTPVVPSASRAQAPSTVLQKDPVCGTYVSVETSLKRIVHGHVYHFCSPECRNRFRA
jgi:YHS domain-containing protein